MRRPTAVGALLTAAGGAALWATLVRPEAAYVGDTLADFVLARLGPAPRLEVAAQHPMRYYVTLPRSWRPDRTWPVVVTLDGADRDFRWNHRAFARARGDRPFIVVTPFVLSNGGRLDPRAYPYPESVWDEVARSGADGPLRFDEAGVLAVLDDVHERFGGARCAFLAGYSAGGHAMWVLALRRPTRFAAVAAASANFAARGLTPASPTAVAATARAPLPIRAFFGRRDRRLHALEAQWQAASQWARAMGMDQLSAEYVAGWGHSPFAGQALAYFAAQTVATDPAC